MTHAPRNAVTIDPEGRPYDTESLTRRPIVQERVDKRKFFGREKK